MKRYITILLFVLSVPCAFGQQKTTAVADQMAFRGQIIGKGKPYKDKIALRWNVDNYQVFQKLALGGVFIDRLTIGKDNKAEGTWTRITKDTVKAMPLNSFNTPKIKSDTAMVVIAQMLYGKSKYPKGTGLLDQIKMQDEERQNKHMIASLYTAVSPTAAMAAGLGYEDKMEPDTNKKYVYRIYPAKGIPLVGRLDTGFVYIVGRDFKVEERFKGLETESGEKTVLVKWKRETSPFSGYYVERSEDKKNFKRLTKNIFLPSADTIPDRTYFYFSDSVTNYKKYYYRLKGVNAFGEVKLFNDTVMGMGKDFTPPTPPTLSFERKANEVTFKWTGAKDQDLKGYYLIQGKGITKGDTTLTREILPAATNTYKITLPANFSAAYYRLLLTDTADNVNYTNPVYVFNPDTVPPVAPVGLKGKIDSLGKIVLTWPLDQNEPTLRGYKVFIANQADHEYTAISNIIADTTFTFSTTLKTLTKNLYVKIAAVDASFNHSKFSKALVLDRPDTIAPPRPVLLSYANGPEGISLKWSEDKSVDFSHYLLFKRFSGDTVWNQVLKTRNTLYKDSLVLGGKSYEYALMSVDSAGLSSAYSFPMNIRTSAVLIQASIAFKAVYDKDKKKVSLNWNRPAAEVSHYVLYKDKGKGLVMYKSVPGGQTAYADDAAEFSNELYGLKIVYADKTESEIKTISP